MIKKHVTTYKGMSKDLSRDKQSDKYFDAKNIRILSTDQKSSIALTNEAGNEFIFNIPKPVINTIDTQVEYNVNGVDKNIKYSIENSSYPRCDIENSFVLPSGEVRTSGDQVIIGVKEARDSAIIITTDDNGFDCFWELKNLNTNTVELDLLYINDLSLSKSNLVQILFNYENSVIQKIYFVDGKNQIRFFNTKQSIENGDSRNLIDVPVGNIDSVSPIKMTQVHVDSIVDGGQQTSGMIQYACNFYILNGSQTTISPLSELTPIGKGGSIGGGSLGGGAVNENLGRSVNVVIRDIDKRFSHIKLYSIKYTSLNETPEIKIILDKEIGDFNELRFTDNGGEAPSISVEAFTFLGSSPIIPKHIVSKDNRLFPINITEDSFDVDIDTRAYSFDSSGEAIVMNNPYIDSLTGDITGAQMIVPADFNVPEKYDSINRDYSKYKYIKDDNSVYGGTGKYIEVKVKTEDNIIDVEKKKFLKDREIYRFGLKFYNRRGQFTEPKWIMDIVAPSGNLDGNYNQLEVSFTSDFYVWLNDSSNFDSENDKPVGYKVMRSQRLENDKTIVTQGLLNGMITHGNFNRLKDSEAKDFTNGTDVKMPSVQRMFSDELPFKQYKHACKLKTEVMGSSRGEEMFRAAIGDDQDWQATQNNKIMQIFSPESSFSNVSLSGSLTLRIVGCAYKKNIYSWAQEMNPVTRNSNVDVKFYGGVNVSSPGVSTSNGGSREVESGSSGDIGDLGFFGPSNGKNTMSSYQLLRDFRGGFTYSSLFYEEDIYGTPEFTDRGASFKKYNGDDNFNYCNNLLNMRLDKHNSRSQVKNDSEVTIKGANTFGEKCITIVLGPDDISFPPGSRPDISSLDDYSATNYASKNRVMLTELCSDKNQLYVGSMYGGMSYAAKKSSTYIEVGSYQDISNPSFIESPGDTFVQDFKFLKMSRGDEWIESRQYGVYTEIVYIKVESSIDLVNRNDDSFSEWDNADHPKYSDYEEYNRVYSQEPNLSIGSGLGTKIKKIKEFDTRITASKEKIPGEFVDSWTDMLENEYMDLDGKYGPVNAVVNLKDEIYCLQDNAVAHISINPRVQVSPSDGVALELGTGGILHDYTYLSSEVGTVNKWGVIASENAFYFADPITKSIVSFSGGGITRLSDVKGMHYEFYDRMTSDLRIDNPVLGSGISCGYNSVNSDVYFSFHQNGRQFTIGFNEKVGEFISFYDYVPSWYINRGDKMITTDPTNNQLWEHFKGKRNHFYGQQHRSTLTIHIAPQGDEIILNNASYKMELTNQYGVEVPNKGLTKVRAYNDYQDSGEVELIMRSNLFNKFRNWKINLPRQRGSRSRVRSSWGFVDVIFENEDGNRLILHDISIFYTQY